MSPWDAVVVGGGPAGAATAARLAREGARVLVLDRAAFPRRKPCGECVSPAGVAALRELGVWGRLAAAGPEPLRGWRIQSPSGQWFSGRFPAARPGLALPRTELDQALLEHASGCGAVVRSGGWVRDLVWRGGRVAGVRCARGEVVHAAVVIGADGLRSLVARRAGMLRRPPRLRKVALTAHLSTEAGPPAGWGELRVSRTGCVGVAAVGGGLANVTVVVAAGHTAGLAGDPSGFFDRAVAGCGLAGERTDPVLATGPFDFPVRSAAAKGVLLVGDAAGYYDPFTGQGIFRALRGAELAAGALAEGMSSGDLDDSSKRYARAHRSAFRAGERLQHAIEQFVARPTWLDWAAGRLRRDPALADAVVQAAGDLLHPLQLLHPRLLQRLTRRG